MLAKLMGPFNRLRAWNIANQGWRHYLAEQYDEAISAYNRAIQLDPTNATLYSYRGASRASQGDYESALVDLNEAIRLNPHHIRSLLERALVHCQLGDAKAGVEDYNLAVKLGQPTSVASTEDGLNYFVFGSTVQSYAAYYHENPLTAFLMSCTNRVRSRLVQGDYQGALNYQNQLIDLTPESSYVYVGRGQIYFLLNDYSQALREFQKAHELESASYQATFGLAVTYFQLGQLPEAEHFWRELLAIDPHYSDADWVGKELNWQPPLVEAARKLLLILNLNG